MTTNNYFRGDAVKKVWLNRYPADVPAEINPDRYQSLVELFEHAHHPLRRPTGVYQYG